jgi:hypothetical protein
MQSDLRVAIFKALGAAGIEIPFNQVDVNLRDLDAIKRYLAEHQQERAADPAQSTPATAMASASAARSAEARARRSKRGARPRRSAERLLLPEHLLAALVALLRLERERGDRAGIEALEPDRLAGLLAIAVGALLDAQQRRIDLGDQLALAIAGPELERAVCLGRGAIGEIGGWAESSAARAASRGSGGRSLPSNSRA